MAIDKIINDIQSRQIIQNRANEATSGKKEKTRSVEDSTDRIKLEDRVTFSQDAKKMQEIEIILQNALHKLHEMDEINHADIGDIKVKLESGFYDQNDVAESIINDIFPEEELRKIVEKRIKAGSYLGELHKLDTYSQIDRDKIDNIKEKINSGFYDTKEVASKTADEIISILDV